VTQKQAASHSETKAVTLLISTTSPSASQKHHVSYVSLHYLVTYLSAFWLTVATGQIFYATLYVYWSLCVSSKESSSIVDGSKSASNSLQRSTSLSLTTLPHRSKSLKAKVQFGDMSDDIHVGIQCLRAIMNNQVHVFPAFFIPFFTAFIWILFVWCCLQCFGAVGSAAGRASGL